MGGVGRECVESRQPAVGQGAGEIMNVIYTQALALKHRCAAEPGKFMPWFRQTHPPEEHTEYELLHLFEGFGLHLLYRAGFEAPPPGWSPRRPLPDEEEVVRFILDILEDHARLWQNALHVSIAVSGCACVVDNSQDIDRVMRMLVRLSGNRDPDPFPVLPDADAATNGRIPTEPSVRGKAAESAVLLAIHLKQKRIPFPALLPPTLFGLASDAHPAVRATLLKRLPELAKTDDLLAWRLFEIAEDGADHHLWPFQEPFLWSRFAADYNRVLPRLYQKRRGDNRPQSRQWAEALARGYIDGEISENVVLKALDRLGSEAVWAELLACFHEEIELIDHSRRSEMGIFHLVEHMPAHPVSFDAFCRVFQSLAETRVDLPVQLAYTFISAFNGIPGGYRLDWFFDWLARLAAGQPFSARQLCAHLLARMETSSAQFEIWRGERFLETVFAVVRIAGDGGDLSLKMRAMRLKQQGSRR